MEKKKIIWGIGILIAGALLFQFTKAAQVSPLEKIFGQLADRLGQIEIAIKNLTDATENLHQDNLDKKQPQLGGIGSVNQRSCSYATSSVTTLTQTSQVVLATSSSRAWARIHQVQATSTVYLNFNGGPAVVAASSTTIALNATSSAPFIEFGLNTEFPYTGAVTGVVDAGSTAVRVTECNWSQ